MTDTERREAARQFINKWNGRGNEDQDSQLYWIDFLAGIVGMDNVTDRVSFEKKVFVNGHQKKIDVYIPETHTLIEQKSYGKALDKKITNSGDIDLTPYEQAKRYNDNLQYDERARWIVTSNFAEIWIYDMNKPVPEKDPVKIMLTELQTKFSLFDFMADKEKNKLSQEMQISIKAGDFVGLIYDALLKQYINPNSAETMKSLNMLCVRLVFCLYAEDAHIFGNSGRMFHDYMDSFETKDMRKALIELFKILDTPEDKRDPYDKSALSEFPYVNGGLFEKEDIEIPNFTEEIRDILLSKASEGFDWSMISPTIFGAVFESTLNPETRRSGGMHYTSIENIHKVIDPLFLDELKQELKEIKQIQVIKTRNSKLKAYQDKLSKLTWLDPACGSGNFLTETYLSIRTLENDVINTLKGGQMAFVDDPSSVIKVSISQFYGIEINDFAVTVAKTALWIAESQMMKKTEDILLMQLNFLPLKTNANIIEGNALRIDWDTVVPKSNLNYIMGNPPFIGHQYRSKEQTNDMKIAFWDLEKFGKLDYVASWYNKSLDLIKNTKIKCSFVSTNSIVQGESVSLLWRLLFDKGLEIQFAYPPFIWDSEANEKAKVHCVIVGFTAEHTDEDKTLIKESSVTKCKHINGYLMDAPDIYIESRGLPLNVNMPIMSKGSQPTDGGNLILSAEERNEMISKYPNTDSFIKRYISADDYINNKTRYCLWLKDVSPAQYKGISLIKTRLEAIVELRKKSPTASVQRDANTPALFTQIRQPNATYIAMPEVSSSRRRYIPFGFISPDIIASNMLYLIPDANLYLFGVMNSNVHMAWVRVVSGRLKSDYRYTPAVYNNFPWPSPTEEQKRKIEQTAQGILDVRELYHDSSLADLYDPLTMPPELHKAHTANDKAVMAAYGFLGKNMSEADCVAELMKMYQRLTEEKKG